MTKLTPALLAEKYPDVDLAQLTAADVIGATLTHVDSLKGCDKLRKLNVSSNAFRKSDALSGLRKTKTLTWLNASSNELIDMDVFDSKFASLLVLNLGSNAIQRIPSPTAQLTSLNALILNNNSLLPSPDCGLNNLSGLINLNTLVLSHNPNLTSLDTLPNLPALVKLSCAECGLTSFPLDLPKRFPNLRELRLSGNSITSIPLRSMITLGDTEHTKATSKLCILELGNNPIEELEDIVALRNVSSTLTHITLKGSPFAKKSVDDDDPTASLTRIRNSDADNNDEKQEDETLIQEGMPPYSKTLIEILPNLKVVDGIRFDPKFIARRKKRQELEQKLKEIDEKKRNHDAKVKRLQFKETIKRKQEHIQELESKLQTLDDQVAKFSKKAKYTGAYNTMKKSPSSRSATTTNPSSFKRKLTTKNGKHGTTSTDNNYKNMSGDKREKTEKIASTKTKVTPNTTTTKIVTETKTKQVQKKKEGINQSIPKVDKIQLGKDSISSKKKTMEKSSSHDTSSSSGGGDDFFFSTNSKSSSGNNNDSNDKKSKLSVVKKVAPITKAQRQRQRQKEKKKSTKDMA